MRDRRLQDRKETAYGWEVPEMNRKERRTARGRVLVAEAEARSLQAENEFLKEELARLKGD